MQQVDTGYIYTQYVTVSSSVCESVCESSNLDVDLKRAERRFSTEPVEVKEANV